MHQMGLFEDATAREVKAMLCREYPADDFYLVSIVVDLGLSVWGSTKLGLYVDVRNGEIIGENSMF